MLRQRVVQVRGDDAIGTPDTDRPSRDLPLQASLRRPAGADVNFGGAAAGMVGLVLALKRRQLIGTFDKVGATSATTARSREELGIRDSRLFRRLARRGVLHSAGDGTYFLDRLAAARDRRRRRLVVAIVALLAVVGLAIALAGAR